jgi:hypothetical protein
MSSLLKHVTNRANSLHSTGPKTPEGKAVSSQNALKHGLSAKQLNIQEEERPEFEQLQAGLLDDLQPQGTLEQLVFNDLLHARWKLHRCRGIEASLSTGDTDPLLDESLGKQLDRILRYEARAERNFYRSLKELRTLQQSRDRKEADPAPPPTPQPEPVTKRTQLPEEGALPDPPETRRYVAIGENLPEFLPTAGVRKPIVELRRELQSRKPTMR